MALPLYSTGTVTVAAGGTSVTGVGTIWTGGNVSEGDEFCIGSVRALVVDVVSATQLTITAWAGAALAGATYQIYQNSPRRFDDVQIADDLRKQVQALNQINYFIPVQDTQAAPDPSLGDENQRAFQDLTGKWWKKEAGVWNLKGNPYGLQPAQNLADLTDPNQALVNLGAQNIGRWMFTAPDVESSPNGVLSVLGFSALGKTLRAVADAAAARVALALGSLATRNISDTFWFTNSTDSTSSTTGALATSGGLGVAKTIYAGGDIQTSTSFRSTANSRINPQIQLQNQTGYTIANGNNDVVAPQNFYGLMIVSDGQSGSSALILCAYQTPKLIGNTSTVWSDTPASGKIYVSYASGYGYLINNNAGSSIAPKVGLIRLN